MEDRNIFKRFDDVKTEICKFGFNRPDCIICSTECFNGTLYTLDDKFLNENELDSYLLIDEATNQ